MPRDAPELDTKYRLIDIKKQIKRFIYWDHYHPNATEEDYAVQSGHIGRFFENNVMKCVCS